MGSDILIIISIFVWLVGWVATCSYMGEDEPKYIAVLFITWPIFQFLAFIFYAISVVYSIYNKFKNKWEH